jgi:hypothetical protein
MRKGLKNGIGHMSALLALRLHDSAGPFPRRRPNTAPK